MRHNLRKHLRAHAGTQQWKCLLCPAVFSKLKLLEVCYVFDSSFWVNIIILLIYKIIGLEFLHSIRQTVNSKYSTDVKKYSSPSKCINLWWCVNRYPWDLDSSSYGDRAVLHSVCYNLVIFSIYNVFNLEFVLCWFPLQAHKKTHLETVQQLNINRPDDSILIISAEGDDRRKLPSVHTVMVPKENLTTDGSDGNSKKHLRINGTSLPLELILKSVGKGNNIKIKIIDKPAQPRIQSCTTKENVVELVDEEATKPGGLKDSKDSTPHLQEAHPPQGLLLTRT